MEPQITGAGVADAIAVFPYASQTNTESTQAILVKLVGAVSHRVRRRRAEPSFQYIEYLILNHLRTVSASWNRRCAKRGAASPNGGTAPIRCVRENINRPCGRAAGRQTALDFGAQEFVDLENDALEDVGGIDLVFDVIGGDIPKRSAGLIRAGGTLVSIAGPAEARPADGLTVDFVVMSDRPELSQIVRRVRDGGCGRTSATSRPSTMPSSP